MVIFREKLFRRDIITDEVKMDLTDDPELRARKDRMRKDAPYRKNSKSIMSKKK